jgi:hypothetical protein
MVSDYVGRTYLACALAQQALSQRRPSHLPPRVPLLQELAIVRADGTYGKLLGHRAKVDVLVSTTRPSPARDSDHDLGQGD